jgi:hypothetical protein
LRTTVRNDPNRRVHARTATTTSSDQIIRCASVSSAPADASSDQ